MKNCLVKPRVSSTTDLFLTYSKNGREIKVEAKNVLFTGLPGCGKSILIEKIVNSTIDGKVLQVFRFQIPGLIFQGACPPMRNCRIGRGPCSDPGAVHLAVASGWTPFGLCR